MEEQGSAVKFNSHAQFQEHLRNCIARSQATLQMFDPDFSVFPLAASDVDALLRGFLARGGAIQLALHRPGHIEREYPRFIRLLKDYSHRIECRATSRGLHQLTDSFCIGDRVHIVRRFHSDHMRGEAAFCMPEAAELSLERFDGIWADSVATLHPTVTGL
jgi:hypothetical protein